MLSRLGSSVESKRRELKVNKQLDTYHVKYKSLEEFSNQSRSKYSHQKVLEETEGQNALFACLPAFQFLAQPPPDQLHKDRSLKEKFLYLSILTMTYMALSTRYLFIVVVMNLIDSV